jgi:predicted porin
MKKTLIALAALAATGAFAQSSVSIWGAVDASYNYASADLVAGNQTKSSMGNSQLGSSKLGFSGVEDVGGGLKAKFWLEAGLANDSGAGKSSNSNNQSTGAGGVIGGSQGIVFQRRSYVGLVGNFGEVQLGRQYVNTFLGVQAAADPFGTNGPADSTQMMLTLGATKGVATITNASNMVTYITPTMGGFSGNVQFFMGENVSGAANSDDGGGYSVTGQYAAGPLFVSLGQQQTKYATGDYTLQALSATYDLGVAKLRYTYAHEGVAALAGAGADLKNNSNLFGVSAPFGAFTVKASYIIATNNNNATKVDQNGNLFGVGAEYALSKRSTVYATYGNIKNNDGGAGYGAGVAGALAANGSTSNLAVGVFHAF